MAQREGGVKPCWSCSWNQLGGIFPLGVCCWFLSIGRPAKEIRPEIADKGCKFWTGEDLKERIAKLKRDLDKAPEQEDI